MARKLPDDPDKRRKQIFKRVYQHLDHWEALRQDRGMDDIITTPEGEDIYLGDLLVGLDSLPPRQRQAFELICLQGFTETAARDVILPRSSSSTPVQQYADSALIRMIAAYDAKQEGSWQRAKTATARKAPKKKVAPRTPPPRKWRFTVLHPLVRDNLEATKRELIAQIASAQEGIDQIDELIGLQVKPRLADVAKELVGAS